MKALKSWCSKSLVFSKREFVVVALFLILIGTACGYGWRMIQIEPIRDKEIDLAVREIRTLEDEKSLLIQRISNLESQIGVMQGRHKKGGKRR